jgi:TonB family protein
MPAPHQNAALEALAGPVPPAGGTRFAEHLVLLAHDESLIEALANQLVSGYVGVVFIDAGAAHSPGATAQLTQRLHHQLPDVVLVVAGDGAASSTPPVSEARDPNSVAAVILQRVYSVDPVFPEIARERDLTGFVDLEFTVRADGTVTDVNVLKAQPTGVFEKAAVDAVSKWRYRPIERNGLAVNEHARLRLNFAYK